MSSPNFRSGQPLLSPTNSTTSSTSTTAHQPGRTKRSSTVTTDSKLTAEQRAAILADVEDSEKGTDTTVVTRKHSHSTSSLRRTAMKNEDDDEEQQELVKEPSTRIEYARNPVKVTLPTTIIDRDADTPLASSDDDEGANGANDAATSSRLTLGRNRSGTMTKRSLFKGKGVTTKLHTACFASRYDDAKEILDHDEHAYEQLMIQDATGEVPLHKAITVGCLKIVELLCDFADGKYIRAMTAKPIVPPIDFKERFLETKNGKGATPLYKATKTGRPEIVYRLVLSGANCNTADNEGLPAVCIAAKNDHGATLNVLIEEGKADAEARQPYTDYTPLLVATRARSLGCVRVLLGRDNMCNRNAVGSQSQWSAVHIATYYDDVEMLEILLQGKVDPNLVTIDGDTALHIAAFNNSYAVCEVLVKFGKADKKKKNNAGFTAYEVAVERGNTKLFPLLKPGIALAKNSCPCVIQ